MACYVLTFREQQSCLVVFLTSKSYLAFVYRYLVLNIADSPIENIIPYIQKVSVYCACKVFRVVFYSYFSLGNSVTGTYKLVLARCIYVLFI